jgi:hypothetical protein
MQNSAPGQRYWLPGNGRRLATLSVAMGAAMTFFARLDAEGNILVASSTRPDNTGKFTNPALDAGQYEVHFNQDVRGCRWRRCTIPARTSSITRLPATRPHGSRAAPRWASTRSDRMERPPT